MKNHEEELESFIIKSKKYLVEIRFSWKYSFIIKNQRINLYMVHRIRNDKGIIIDGIKELQKKEYGTGKFHQNGEPIVNWKLLSDFADDNGFDIRNIEHNNEYKMDIKLPYGTIIIRYGNETGVFSAPKGTKYEDLALPYIKDTVEYNEYKVIAHNVNVTCKVVKGKVAPGFASNGGAIQYMHPISIKESIRRKLLKRMIK